jgi:hypothetical protein
MLKGIVLIATGHPYYGRWAYNMALSLKANEDFPIALLYTSRAISHLTTDQLRVFDNFVEVPTLMESTGTWTKLLAGELSPWQETIILDVDAVFLNRKPSDLFKEVSNVCFTAITEGCESDPSKNYNFWAEPKEIREKYKLKEEVYQWRSEILYFNDDGRKVLKRALEIVKEHKLTSATMHGERAPDELGLCISAAEYGLKPSIYKWSPSYWAALHNNIVPSLSDLHRKYFLLSCGNNFVPSSVLATYNQLMIAYCYKMNVPFLFPMESKRNFLKERKRV